MEQAKDYIEAQALCAEYSAETIDKEHLQPWVVCYEKVFLKFPKASSDVDYVIFFRSVNDLSRSVAGQDDQEIQMPVALVNDAMHEGSIGFSRTPRKWNTKILEKVLVSFATHLKVKRDEFEVQL